MAWLEADAPGSESLHPAPKEGRRLELLGKDPSAGSDEGFDAKISGPCPNLLVPKLLNQEMPELRGSPPLISCGKLLRRFGVTQVKTSMTRHQKLPSHGWLSLKEGDLEPRINGNFSGPQSRRSTSDNG